MTRLPLVALLLFVVPAYAGPEESAVRVSYLRFQDGADGRQMRAGGDGSGTVVRNAGGVSWVLTNRHVAPADGGFAFVRVRDGRVFAAAEVVADDAADLALLRVHADLGPAATLADAEPAVGVTLRQWGHSLGGPMRAKSGPVMPRRGDRDGLGRAVQPVAIRVEPGDSGSGAFDAGGRLALVCYLGNGTTGGYVPLSDVRRFLGRVIDGKPGEAPKAAPPAPVRLVPKAKSDAVPPPGVTPVGPAPQAVAPAGRPDCLT